MVEKKHNKNDEWCVIWNIYEKLFHIISIEMLIRYFFGSESHSSLSSL